jgi:hypothetical protein
MVDSLTTQLNGLQFSASELRELTDWPEALIEDYLSLLNNFNTVATAVDPISGLTANRLVGTGSTGVIASINDLSYFVKSASANQVAVANNGDGTVSLSLPQDIDTGANFQVASVQVGLFETNEDYTLENEYSIVNSRSLITPLFFDACSGTYADSWEDKSRGSGDSYYSSGRLVIEDQNGSDGTTAGNALSVEEWDTRGVYILEFDWYPTPGDEWFDDDKSDAEFHVDFCTRNPTYYFGLWQYNRCENANNVCQNKISFDLGSSKSDKVGYQDGYSTTGYVDSFTHGANHAVKITVNWDALTYSLEIDGNEIIYGAIDGRSRTDIGSTFKINFHAHNYKFRSPATYQEIDNISLSRTLTSEDNITVTIPSDSYLTLPGRPWIVTNTSEDLGSGSATLTIDPGPLNTVNGESSLVLYNQYDAVIAFSDGANSQAIVVTRDWLDDSAELIPARARDLRVPSNSETHALFVDYSADKIGIFNDSPVYDIDIIGTVFIEGQLGIKFPGSHIVLYDTDGSDPDDYYLYDHDAGNYNVYYRDVSDSRWYLPLRANKDEVVISDRDDLTGTDFRAEASGNAYMLFVDYSAARIGIGTFEPPQTLGVAGSVDITEYAVIFEGVYGRYTGYENEQRIWAVSTQYDNYGIFYTQGAPDLIEFRGAGVTNTGIGLENARVYIGLGNDTSAILELETSGGRTVELGSSDSSPNCYIGTSTSHGFKILTNDTERSRYGANDGYTHNYQQNDYDFSIYTPTYTDAVKVDAGDETLSILLTTTITDSYVLFEGATGVGVTDWDATVKDDVGFLWIPDKGSLRAGYCDTTAWDYANIGMRSFGMGVNADASGTGSVSIGIDTTSSGRASASFGEDGVAAGDYTLVAGFNTTANADYSAVFGSGTASIATAEASIVGGWANVLDTGNAFVTANGDASFVFGYAIAMSGGTGTITSSSTSSEGTFVAGYAFGAGAGAVGTIYASLQGGFAQGYAYSTSGTSGIWSTAQGAFAQGYVVNGTVEATGAGAFAQGYVWITGYSVTAGGAGSFAHGAATTGDILASATNTMAVGDDVSATAANAYVFGLSVDNSTASSFRVGWSTDGGMSLEDDVLELYGGIDIQSKHGDWCVYQSDASGYNYFASPVGIGTNSFASLLAIAGTDRTSHWYYGADEDVYIRPGANTGDVFICDVVGSVCIGTTSQVYKLHVYHDENQVALFQSSNNYAMIELKDLSSGTYGPWLAAYGNEFRLYADYDTISAYQLMVSATEVVVNDQSNENCDFRVEGNAYENLFFVNTDINRVTINYPSTAALGGTNCLFYVQANAETDTIAHFSCDSSDGGILLIEGTSIGTAIVNSFGTGGKDVLQFITVGEETLRLNRDGAIFNYDYDADHDFAVRGMSSWTALFVNSGVNRVGFGTAAPSNEFEFYSEEESPILRIENQNAGGNGFSIQLRKEGVGGTSVATDEELGRINWIARRENDAYTTFFYIRVVATDVTDGGEDAKTIFYNSIGGTNREYITFDDTGIILNYGRRGEIDIRMASESNTHMFWLDSQREVIGINESDPDTAFQMHINSGNTQRTLLLESTNATGKQLVLQASGTVDAAEVMLGCTDNNMVFYAGGQQKMVLASNGYLGIGTGAGVTPDVELHVVDDSADSYIKVESEAASAAGIYFENTVCRWLWRVKAAGDLSLYNATATTDDIIVVNDTTSAITINQDVTISGALFATKRLHLTSTETDVLVAEGSEFDVEWNVQDSIDTAYYTHSTSTAKGTITVDEDGVYHLICNLNFRSTSASVRNSPICYVKVNSTTVETTYAQSYDRGSSYGGESTLKIVTLLDLSANDTVEIFVDGDNIDGNLYLDYSRCELHMWRL